MAKNHATDETLTSKQVIAEIDKEIAGSSVRGLARERGVKAPQLSGTRLGKIPISEKLAKAFGFQREVYTEVRFRRIKGNR